MRTLKRCTLKIMNYYHKTYFTPEKIPLLRYKVRSGDLTSKQAENSQ